MTTWTPTPHFRWFRRKLTDDERSLLHRATVGGTRPADHELSTTTHAPPVLQQRWADYMPDPRQPPKPDEWRNVPLVTEDA